MPEFPRGVEVCAGALIVNLDGQLLIIKSKKWRNLWTIPAGHVEPGESLIAAAIREVHEETGIKYTGQPPLIYHGELINSPDFHRPAHFIFFDYLFLLDVNPDIECKTDEYNKYAWVDIKDLHKYKIERSTFHTIVLHLKRYCPYGIPIEILKLSPHVHTAFAKNNINTLLDLAKKTPKELQMFRYFSEKHIVKIENELDRFNLSLKK